jgi:hypothetical protein
MLITNKQTSINTQLSQPATGTVIATIGDENT